MGSTESQSPTPIPFKAETRQLLNILIHSLYTEKEVFLRELISNAADALTRINFEMLTNRNIVDPDTELGIWITFNEKEKELYIRDNGIGMTAEDLSENLGTIAYSGAHAFIEAVEKGNAPINDIIGQFGVGFYSAFMVAEWIRVTSRSYLPDASPASWFSHGSNTFTIEPSDMKERGTLVTIKLKEEAAEFCKEYRLQSIIKKHSDYIPYPIYLGEEKKQANSQTALWRQFPSSVEEMTYLDFYKQFTLDVEAPITQVHMVVDAPVQMYALLFIPSTADKNIFTLRKEDGLKLYARKVLIQEYCKDLLPDFFRFIQGVVDSEDLPLNVSRESIQSNRVMAQLNKLISIKLLDTLNNLAQNRPEDYLKFWKSFGRFIEEGVATNTEHAEALFPFLRFNTLNKPDGLASLDEYINNLKTDQDKIYYILGDDPHSIQNSPHLEAFRHHGYDVLLMSDPLSAFMLLKLKKYKEFELINVSSDTLKIPELEKTIEEELENGENKDKIDRLVKMFKDQLGEKVTDVRITNRLVESPARLVDPQGSTTQEMQKVYHLLNHEYKTPQKILEINPNHPILRALSACPPDETLISDVIEQIYENSLLIEGLLPDPASMINRIQNIIVKSLK